MPPKKDKTLRARPILGRIAPDEFVGRRDALAEVLRLASPDAGERGLLLLAAPSVGVSELLRQAYDKLFRENSDAIPIYFALTLSDRTAQATADHFLRTFLQQFVAFRRQDAKLSLASLSIPDLIELIPPGDYEWAERLVEMAERSRGEDDPRAFIRLCLSAPQRAASSGAKTIVLLDGLQIAERLNAASLSLGTEFAQA